MIKRIIFFVSLVTVMFVCTFGYAQSITSIKITGNSRIQSDYILSLLLIKEGSEYNQGNSAQDLRRLYNTDLFEDISTSFNNGILTITVKENPLINQVSIIGNNKLKKEVLEKEILSKNRTTFSQGKLNLDVQRITNLYYQSGYLSVVVSSTTQQKDHNRVDVVIEITEGSKTIIDKVKFIGNKGFSKGDLESTILTKEDKWYRIFNAGNVYDKNRILYDGELLKQFYLENGYPNFSLIATDTEFSIAENAFTVSYLLEEGERYKFGDVVISIKNPEILQYESALESLVYFDQTAWFRNSLVNRESYKIREYLNNLGYQFVGVSPQFVYNDILRKVDVIFVIYDEERIFVNRIDIYGNGKTRDHVIRREIKLLEGNPYSKNDADLSIRDLYRTGYFSSVTVDQSPTGSYGDETNLTVNVLETSTASISAGGGYSTLEKLQVEMSINENNLFGTGLKTGFSVNLSQSSNSYSLSLGDPYFLGRNLYLGASVYRRDTGKSILGSTVTNSSSSYTKTEQGLGLNLGYALSDDWRHSIAYNIYQRHIFDVKDGVALSIRELQGRDVISSVTNTFSYDGRNNAFYPTSGMEFSLSTDYAGIGGNVYYIKNVVRGVYYKELYEDLVFSTLASAGQITGLNGQKIRIADKFLLGGSTLRGFSIGLTSGGLGPLDEKTKESLGGMYMVRGSFQLDYPLPGVQNYGLIAYVFNDWGTITDFSRSSSVIDSGKIRASVGVGISWKSPAGTISLDLAKPIIKDKYDTEEMIFINFGTRL